MTAPVTSPIGRALYELLPTLYRARDNGDLAHYLDACGSLLDAVRALLDQRLADTFIEIREEEAGRRTIQPWLVPYIAQLLDVRLASPLVGAQRAEIANGVTWRQQKGTLGCALQIAHDVGGMQVKIQEGWRRVATTPHVAMPLVPHPGSELLERQSPLAIARHSSLSAVTVDLREGPHRTPVYPGGSDDQSKCTVDLRTPSWRVGHVHPKRLLVYASPPDFFFPADQQEVVWQGLEHEYEELELSYDEEAGRWTLRNPDGERIKINGCVTLKGGADDIFRFEDVYFTDTLTVETGALELERVVACKVEVQAEKTDTPILWSRNTLLGEIQVPCGLARLEYCTVLCQTLCAELRASDCVFGGALQLTTVPSPFVKTPLPLGERGQKSSGTEQTLRSPEDDDPEQRSHKTCVRYSRIPPDHNLGKLATDTCRTAQPVFYSPALGQFGGGALHPATPDSIRFGAEDGGEMGAYHHLAHCLNTEALREKLADFLPLGMETAVIPDLCDRYWRPYAFASSFARGFRASYAKVFFRGTPNGWDKRPMNLVADHTWQITVSFGSGPSERFRFNVTGDGSITYGENDTPPFDPNDPSCAPCALGSWVTGTSGPDADIPVTEGAGSYLITFNDQSKAYKVTKQ